MSVIIALIVFSILILVHEFGHFLLAKKNGVCVVEFSLGMGPRILSFVKGETRYSWKAVPFGGSCAMLGDGMVDEENIDEERSFEKKSVWARISILAAGPIFNFLLAFILALIVIGFAGVDKAQVLSVDEKSAAATAGLQVGDVITRYNGTGVSVSREVYLQDYVKPISSEAVKMTVLRDGKSIDLVLNPTKIVRYMMGISYTANATDSKITVSENSAFDVAGIKSGDIITEINGTAITTGEDIANYVKEHPLDGTVLNIKVSRDGTTIERQVTPKESTYYQLGMDYNVGREKVGSLDTIKYSFCEIKYQIKSVFKSLGMLFSGKLKKDDLAGPVGVVNVISDTVQETKSDGWFYMILNILNLTILLSANLGVMNLLPIPALDGGRLVFLIIELFRGKPVPKEKEGIVHFVGMVFLMILMVFVMFNDITRLFR